MGGIRGLWQTHIPLEGCAALVFPDMFALPHANEAVDDSCRLHDLLLPILSGRGRRPGAHRGDGLGETHEPHHPALQALGEGGNVKALESESELQPPNR